MRTCSEYPGGRDLTFDPSKPQPPKRAETSRRVAFLSVLSRLSLVGSGKPSGRSSDPDSVSWHVILGPRGACKGTISEAKATLRSGRLDWASRFVPVLQICWGANPNPKSVSFIKTLLLIFAKLCHRRGLPRFGENHIPVGTPSDEFWRWLHKSSMLISVIYCQRMLQSVVIAGGGLRCLTSYRRVDKSDLNLI